MVVAESQIMTPDLQAESQIQSYLLDPWHEKNLGGGQAGEQGLFCRKGAYAVQFITASSTLSPQIDEGWRRAGTSRDESGHGARNHDV